MKPSQKVNKMVLVDFNEYSNMINRASTSNLSLDPVREKIYEDERLSDRDKVELDSYILRNRNRVRFEEKTKQEDEISKLVQYLRKMTTKPGEQKHVSTSTGTTGTTDTSTSMDTSMYFPEMVDKGILVRPKMVNASTQITKNYGENPEDEYQWSWYQSQNDNHSTPNENLNKSKTKTPKSSDSKTSNKIKSTKPKTPKTPKPPKPPKPPTNRALTRSESSKNEQSGFGNRWRGWYRMPFN